jgi:acetyl/propionyl-CoA carboxylase alpha subunit
MEYRLTINDQTHSLHVVPGKGDTFFVTRNGEKSTQVSFQPVSDGHLLLHLDGKIVHAFVADGSDGKHVFMNGRTFLLREVKKQPARKRNIEGGTLPEQVSPPMPSVVVRILVTVGDRVRKGQGLVVVSAMKMETTLAAPYDGEVAAINTRVDAKVAPGDILVDLKNEGGENE